MTYPPVIQFQTRALEAEAHARLALERRAAHAPERTTTKRWRPTKRFNARAVGFPRRSHATPVPNHTQGTRA